MVIFVIEEIFWDVYFVLDRSKCNNNFMKQNCMDTLDGWLFLCRTQSFDTSTHMDLMKMPKKYKWPRTL